MANKPEIHIATYVASISRRELKNNNITGTKVMMKTQNKVTQQAVNDFLHPLANYLSDEAIKDYYSHKN